MRQIIVLVFLLALMQGLKLLKDEPDLGIAEGDPLTLATIGFVLLAAYTVAELGSRLKLPKVTGYIVTGIVLGPYLADILSLPVVNDMKMFKDLALGLIATSAGLELDGRGLGRMWRSLASITGLKILLLPIFVGGTFYGLESSFHFLGLETQSAVLGLSIIFSALAVGTSPAIALAVLSETKAKGKLSDLVLGIAVLKDVVVVICLAIAVAITRSLISPDASLDASVFVHVGEELGYSILAGIVLAGLLYLYIRFIKAEMLLFVAAMILTVAELTAALHLELLLVFIVAGFIIRNFTPYEHDLLHPLEVVALPVFVVFFTNAGATVNLPVTMAILPFALALCAARVVAFVLAGRFGSKLGGDPPIVQKVSWLAYLPQAGVTLGLVGLAAEQLPDLGTPIMNAGLAVVAINLLVGPITLRLGLKKSGDIPEAEPTQAADESGESQQVSAAALSRQAVVDPATEPLAPPPERKTLESEALERELEAIEAAIRSRVEVLIEDELQPWADAYKASVDAFFSTAEEREDALKEMLRWAAKPAGDDLDARVGALRELFDDLRAACSELVVELPIPTEDRFLFGVEGDGVIRRLRKFGARLFVPGKAKTRVVPLRMATRMTIEPRVAEALRGALGQWGRMEAQLLVELRRLGQGIQTVDEARSATESLLDQWIARFRRDADYALAYGLRDLAESLEIAGSRELPSRKVRYSKVEPQVTAILAEIDARGAAWAQGLAAAKASLRLALLLERLELHVSRVVESGFLVPLGRLLDSIGPEVSHTREQLHEGDAEVEGLTTEDLDEPTLTALVTRCRKAFPQESHIRIKQLRAEFKQDVSAHDLAIEMRELVAALPESIDVLDADAKLHRVREPSEIAIFSVPMRRICEQALIHDFLPQVDEHLREANLLVNAVNSQIREHVGVATYAVEVVLRGHVRGGIDARALIRDGFGRGLRRLDELAATIERVREETLARVREERVAAFEAIRADAARRRSGRGPARDRGLGLGVRTRRRLERVGKRLAESGLRGAARLRRALKWLQLEEPMTEVQQRFAAKARFDAHDIRELLYSDVREHSAKDDLPPIYGRLYSLESVHERRFFTARRGELRAVMRAEQAWREGKGPSGILLVGRRGSGRTSLLNIAQIEVGSKRVIRVGDDDDRAGGLLAAIADELRCAPDLVELRVALRSVKTAIIIDDLESWVRPDPRGLREFERILDVIIATRGEAFWLAAVDEDALGLLDPLTALRQAFDRVLTLGPLEADVLARVIEVRNRISGLDVVYPTSRIGRLLRRRVEVSRRDYYRGLARQTDGNLRAALRRWHREATLVAGDTIAPSPTPNAADQVRFLDQIHPHALAIVVQAVRFGDLAVETLSQSLLLSSEEVMRHLAFLESAGIIEDEPGTYGIKRIPPEIQPTLSDALRAAGALQREASA
ncbi:MAG: cation:proton antiporter [Nannocystaceae bacterium]